MLSKIFSKVTSSGITSVVKSVGDVIDNLHTSDEEKDQAKAKLKEIEFSHMEKMQELENEAENIYNEEIKTKTDLMMAETKSDDKFVRRFRPMMGYCFLGTFMSLLFMFGIASLFGIPLNITSEFMVMIEIFGKIFLAYISIYVGGRSIEKTIDKVDFSKLRRK